MYKHHIESVIVQTASQMFELIIAFLKTNKQWICVIEETLKEEKSVLYYSMEDVKTSNEKKRRYFYGNFVLKYFIKGGGFLFEFLMTKV